MNIFLLNKYQATLKFIEYLLPLSNYLRVIDHVTIASYREICDSTVNSINTIIQESFFPQSLHVSDYTKLIEDYSSSLLGKDNKNLCSNLIKKIKESIKKYYSSLTIFPQLLSSFIQFIQQYKLVLGDSVSPLNMHDNMDSLQFIFFRELLSTVSDKLLTQESQHGLLNLSQLNVINQMLQTISKYNIYNARDIKQSNAVAVIIDSAFSALSTHSTSKNPCCTK
jgi:hypothetical protein